MYEKKQVPPIEESANWISYNLKRIADQLEQMNGFERPSNPPRQQSHQGQRQGNYQQNQNQNDPPF